MFSTSATAFLKRLLDTPGPSGFEGPAARVWREEAESFAHKVSTDVAGNSLAEVNPGGFPTIMLDGHIDEIGVIVTYIDDDGFVYFSCIGGWDAQVLPGQRIRLLGRNGDVLGVIGKKPIHLMKPPEREQASRITELWIDIGAANGAEAKELVSIGDPVTFELGYRELRNGLAAAAGLGASGAGPDLLSGAEAELAGDAEKLQSLLTEYTSLLAPR